MNKHEAAETHHINHVPEAGVKQLLQTAKEDYANTPLRARLTLFATFGGLSFDWGTGNEAMLSYVASNVHKMTENPAITGLVSGGASFVDQSIIGGLTALTIHEFPKFSDRVREVVTERYPNQRDSKMGRFGRSMILGAGVDLVFAKATDIEGRLDSKGSKIKRALGSAAIIGSANSVILAGMSGVIWAGDKYGFDSLSAGVVNVASNPLTYVGAFGGVYAVNKARKALSNRFKRKNNSEMSKLEFDLIPRDLLRTQDDLVISVSNEVKKSEYDTLWNMVQSGFMDLNRKSYEKQDMTKDELVADLDSESVLKYVARDKDGALVGLLTVHVGLEGINWTDTDSLSAHQMSIDPHARSYYVGTIVVPVDKRGTSVAADLIKSSLIHFQMRRQEVDEDSLVFFDCAGANYPWLGKFIQSQGEPSEAFPQLSVEVSEQYMDAWVKKDSDVRKIHKYTGSAEGSEVIDTQHYYAIRTRHPSSLAQ